jgi:xanthine dehydrogenase accessory factor
MENIWNCANRLLTQGHKICIATEVAVRPSNPRKLGDKCLYSANGFVSGPEWMQKSFLLSEHAAEALKSEKRRLVELDGGGQVFLDVMTSDAHLLMCGAGHIALPLARFACELGFQVTVLDDRPEFANQERFPGCTVLAENFGEALDMMTLGQDDYVVVITRGHEHDVDCLRHVLDKPIKYVGMIGSRRRVSFVFEWLESQGIAREQIDRVFSPIGLSIGAESPEEIALSIAAELVLVRRKGLENALLQRKESPNGEH